MNGTYLAYKAYYNGKGCSKYTKDPDAACTLVRALIPVLFGGRPTSTADRRVDEVEGRERRVPAAASRPPVAIGRRPAPRPGFLQLMPGLPVVGPEGVSVGPPPDVGLHGPRVSQGVGAGRRAYGT